jgi:hypothetical protein
LEADGGVEGIAGDAVGDVAGVRVAGAVGSNYEAGIAGEADGSVEGVAGLAVFDAACGVGVAGTVV